MKLIDAEKVDKIINIEIEKTHAYILHDAQINIKFAVKELPVEFDTEKVIKEIELLRDNAVNDRMSTSEEKEAYCDACERVIEIVKGGGLDDRKRSD